MNEFKSSASKIEFTSYDDLFQSDSTEKAESEVVRISIDEIRDFKNHPFRVTDDEKMDELVESIKEYGILTPGVVRPLKDGSYEMISGHRRKRALERLNIEVMPVIIREYLDDEAAIAMVDANIQREYILPSEKAQAYKMKHEAIKHQGCKAEKKSYDIVGEKSGDNGKTVQRYIRLTYLVDELMDLVDVGKLGFIAAVELSYLSETEQSILYKKMKEEGTVPNGIQATRLKNTSQEGVFEEDILKNILHKEEKKSKNLILESALIKEYFSDDYSRDEMVEVICTLLKNWKQGGEG